MSQRFLAHLPGLVVALGLLAAPRAFAADTQAPRTITVTGQGEAKAAPDEAQISTGVVTQAQTAAAALAANTRAMTQVFATLKGIGIPDKAIRTSEFSVSPQYTAYHAGNGSETQKVTGYQVTNSVSVTIDDLSKLGPALDALVSSGSNSLGSIEFDIRDPKPLMTAAREAAMKDAVSRAQTYAGAGGFHLGPILAVNEGGYEAPRPVFVMEKIAAPAAPPPMAAGEQNVSASVSVTFQIQ